MNTFNINQIVKGKSAGTFGILGFTNELGNETYAILKIVDIATGKTCSGQLALPLSAIETL